MRAFQIGFTLTLAFLITVAFMALNFGFFPPPEGPKRPTYPEMDTPADPNPFNVLSPQSSGSTLPALPQRISPTLGAQNNRAPVAVQDLLAQQNYDDYRQKMEQYERDLEKYEEDSKTFMKEKLVPYIKNMIVRYMVALVVLEFLAIIFVRFISVVVGGAYAMGGLFGVFFGTFGGVFILPYTFMYSLMGSSGTEESMFDITSLFLSIGWVSLGGVVFLTLLAVLLVDGMLRFNMRANSPLPPEMR